MGSLRPSRRHILIPLGLEGYYISMAGRNEAVLLYIYCNDKLVDRMNEKRLCIQGMPNRDAADGLGPN